MHPDTLLSIQLSAIIARNEYTTHPGPVITELTQTAGVRRDLLAQEAGTWAGFHDTDPDKTMMVTALLTIHGADAWVHVGRARRAAGSHKNP